MSEDQNTQAAKEDKPMTNPAKRTSAPKNTQAAKKQAKETEAKVTEVLYVQDLNCQPTGDHETRKHEILDGKGREKTFAFKYGEVTEMPAGDARRLLHIKSFAVFEDADMENRITPTSKANDGKEAQEKGVKLAPGQVIASLDELSDKALFARCCQYPGSEQFNEASSRFDFIAFLREKNGLPDDGDTANDDTAEEMNDEELAGLLDLGDE